jgi:uncharacterized membrane protein (DUF373 family)
MSVKVSIEKLFNLSENIIYIVIAVLLFITSVFLVYDIVHAFLVHDYAAGFIRWIVEIIDKILLMLMVIEIFYTVHVSFKEHVLSPEPFLIVGLIAAIRRILVISVESAYMPEKFSNHMIEMSILGGLIFLFIISLILLRKYLITHN